MSHYDDILQHAAEQRRQHEQYKRECIEFSGKLFEAFDKYLGCPPDRIHFVPFNEETEPNKNLMYTMRVRDDGRLGVCVLLRLEKESEPGMKLLGGTTFHIPYYIDQQNGKFVVQLGDLLPNFLLDENNTDEWESFFDHIVKSIKDNLAEDYKKPPQTRIGFSTP